jgi:hypothetical protein
MFRARAKNEQSAHHGPHILRNNALSRTTKRADQLQSLPARLQAFGDLLYGSFLSTVSFPTLYLRLGCASEANQGMW